MISQPVALGLMFCDLVIVEERTKKVSLIGTFTGIGANRFPAVAQPFSVIAVLTDGQGTATIELVVSRLDTGEVVFTHSGQLDFPDKLAEVTYHIRLRQCSFPAPGQYQFTLLVDREWVCHRRMRLSLREE